MRVLPGPAADPPPLLQGRSCLYVAEIRYLGTSWWNSSGPLAIARAGCVCVCIRHRGAFLQPPPHALVVVLVSLASPWLPRLCSFE